MLSCADAGVEGDVVDKQNHSGGDAAEKKFFSEAAIFRRQKKVSHCRAKQTISLCSRFESSKTIETLAQIATSPKVWVEDNTGITLVEVTTPNIDYNIFGEPSHIHFDICLWQKEVALW